jgi:cytochrome c oxidase subunit II
VLVDASARLAIPTLVTAGRDRRLVVLGGVAVLGCACEGPRSALDPAGRGAEQIADLFWWMTAGAVVIWLAVMGLALLAGARERRIWSLRAARRLIVIGGVAVPTVVLTGLLVYGLALLPSLLAPAPDDGPRIVVTGEQYWWRVRQPLPDGRGIDTANEIHLAVGSPVEFRLESPDVIHSFWIPALGGKIDMIPGRHTRLTLAPTRAGVFEGVCAEYCGASHAWMSFVVVVHEDEAALARWLAEQAEPARTPEDPVAARGQQLFLANGCGACHTVRGSAADGVVGPDLTHVGSRRSLAAGMLANDTNDFRAWITRPSELKPGVHMPAFGMLPDDDLRALAAYLEGLR